MDMFDFIKLEYIHIITVNVSLQTISVQWNQHLFKKKISDQLLVCSVG